MKLVLLYVAVFCVLLPLLHRFTPQRLHPNVVSGVRPDEVLCPWLEQLMHTLFLPENFTWSHQQEKVFLSTQHLATSQLVEAHSDRHVSYQNKGWQKWLKRLQRSLFVISRVLGYFCCKGWPYSRLSSHKPCTKGDECFCGYQKVFSANQSLFDCNVWKNDTAISKKVVF